MSAVEFGPAYAEESGPKSLIGYGFSYAYRRRMWDVAKFSDQNFAEELGFVEAVIAGGGRLHQLADTTGICIHVLHRGSTSICFPQYRLPAFVLDQIVPPWARDMLIG